MRRRTLVPALLASASLSLGLLAGCETLSPTPPSELDLWSDAGAGVEDPRLANLCELVWSAELANHPIRATYLGDPRFHGDLEDPSPRRLDERRREIQEFQRRLRTIDRTALSDADRITWDMLMRLLDTEVVRIDVDDVAWLVDPLEGPHVTFLNVAGVQPVRTARERAQLVERWGKIDGFLRVKSQHLMRGKKAGRVSSRRAVEKTIEQLSAVLAVDPMDSPLVAVATGGGTWVPLPSNASVAEIAHERLGDAREQRMLRQVNLHLQDGERLAIGTRVLLPAEDDPLTAEERGRFLYATLQAVENEVYPAFAAYRELLLKEILPAARPDERPGLVELPGGAEAYRKLIWLHTSLPLAECDPQAIHDVGLQEVARIRGEIAALGERLFGLREVSEIQARLRDDPELFFHDGADIVAVAESSLRRADERIGGYFGILPRAECVVLPIPDFEAKDSTTAYYREPAPPDSGVQRPGRYFVNTWAPETRPRYEAEVLAFHESVPGHHLQIAIAQELARLPAFRRYEGCTAFVEGWALYTERLADEMGLYTSDLDRLGMLSYDAWRASRLVVDTGIHALGWSRAKAIDYLYNNTLLSRDNVENEVDRYIAWPAQALAYKLGQREIAGLRDLARERQGKAFRYSDFHARVLENGAVTLPILRERIRAWLGLAPDAGAVEAAAAR